MAKKDSAKKKPAAKRKPAAKPKPKLKAEPKLKAKPKAGRALKLAVPATLVTPMAAPAAPAESAVVLDRLWGVVMSRREADPTTSHSARLLSRGTAKVAQKFGEESVECIIEAVVGNKSALVAESADVLYHLLVLWVSAGVHPSEVWAELERREGVSGVAEKAARRALTTAAATRKIP